MRGDLDHLPSEITIAWQSTPQSMNVPCREDADSDSYHRSLLSGKAFLQKDNERVNAKRYCQSKNEARHKTDKQFHMSSFLPPFTRFRTVFHWRVVLSEGSCGSLKPLYPCATKALVVLVGHWCTTFWTLLHTPSPSVN